MTPEEEQQACDALVKLGWLETELGLHSEGVRTIQELRQCSVDEARAVLRELRERKLIEEEMSPRGEPDARKLIPPAQLHWVRPRT